MMSTSTTLRTSFFGVLLVIGACLAACGGSPTASGATGASGVTSDKLLADLDDAEIGRLCDWALATEGGAGSVVSCSEHSSRETHTSDVCRESTKAVGSISACKVTVADVEQCSRESGSDPCAKTHPACDAIESCAEKASRKH